MRKTILKLFGASLIVVATAQIANAAQRHNGQSAVTTSLSERTRNAHAYAEPHLFATPSEASRYSGGISAPAGR